MAIYRNITINFWNDSKVQDDFTPEDKYFFLYLMTNPHTNLSGCYEISNKDMERETGYTWDTLHRLIDRLENIHEVIRYSPYTKEVLILNYAKYNWSRSYKLIAAVRKIANHIKNDEFRNIVLENAEKKEKEVDKLESSKNDTDDNNTDTNYTDKQNTEINKQYHSKQYYSIPVSQKSETDVYTDVSIGYTQGIDRVSKSKEKKRSNLDKYNGFPQNTYDFDQLEKELLSNDSSD